MGYPRTITPGDAGYSESPDGAWCCSPHFTNIAGAAVAVTFTGLRAGTPCVIALGYPSNALMLGNLPWSVTGPSLPASGTLATTTTGGGDFTYLAVPYQYFPGTFTPVGSTLTLMFHVPSPTTPTANLYINFTNVYLARADGLDPDEILLSGPSSTLIGVPSSNLTATPSHNLSTVYTPSDGSGGTFTPSTLTWSASSTPKTFTYTPNVLGIHSIGGTLTNSVTLVPGPLPITVNQGVHLVSAHLTPSRQLIECTFADENNLPVFFTRGDALADGATWKINGGSAIPLTTPLKGGQCPFVCWPVCDLTSIAVVDDRDGGPGFTTTGTWVENLNDGSHLLGAFAVKNDQYRTAVWSSPSATATYTFTGLLPGKYDILALIWEIVGPDRTASALYTVKDGSGTTLGTFPFNQTLTLWPHFSRVVGPAGAGNDYTRLGFVTLGAGQTSIRVTLSQTGLTGILATDAMAVRRLATPPATDGDTCTLTIPAHTLNSDNAITGAAVFVEAVTDFPITLVDDSVHMPFDSGRTRHGPDHLKLGYNISAPNYDSISLAFADRAWGCSPWFAAGAGGTIAVDSDGELTAVTNTAITLILGTTTNGVDTRGLVTFTDGITLRFEFDFVPTVSQPVFNSAAQTATKVDAGDSFTVVPTAAVNTAGNHWTFSATLNFHPWTPIAGRTVNFDNHWNPTSVSFSTKSVLRNLKMFDGTAPPGYPYITHQIRIDRLKDKGFGPLRMMDPWGTNNSPVVEFTDFAPTTNRKVGTDLYIGHTAVPTGIRPYDRSAADADGVQAWDYNNGAIPIAVMTFATPHGIKDGQQVVFFGPVTQAPGGGSSIVSWEPGNIVTTFSGTTPTDLICLCININGGGYPGSLANTLANPVVFSDSTIVTRFTSIHPSYHVRSCAELGLDVWANIPSAASDACCAAIVDMCLAGTTPGTKVYVEYGNEMWNTGFEQWLYAVIKRQQYAILHAADPVTYPYVIGDEQQWYAYRSSQHFATALARAALVGRSADIVRIIGAQANDPNSSTADSVSWLAANGKTFDRLTFHDYIDIGTFGQGLRTTANADPSPGVDRLDEQGRLDLLAITALRGDYLHFFTPQHRGILDAHGFGAGGPNPVHLSCYESGFSNLGDHGTVEPTIFMTRLMAGDPRAYHIMLAVFQMLDGLGYREWCRYTLDYNSGAGGLALWCTYPNAVGGPGTGTAGENANVMDLLSLLSQDGGAHLAWAAGAPAPPASGHIPPVGGFLAGNIIAGRGILVR